MDKVQIADYASMAGITKHIATYLYSMNNIGNHFSKIVTSCIFVIGIHNYDGGAFN